MTYRTLFVRLSSRQYKGRQETYMKCRCHIYCSIIAIYDSYTVRKFFTVAVSRNMAKNRVGGIFFSKTVVLNYAN